MATPSTRVRELTVRYRDVLTVAGDSIEAPPRLDSPDACAALLATLLGHEACEVFGLLCVSSTRQLIAYHEVSRGSLDATLVHPREVFKAALLANASAILLAHNHPSGDPTPSPDDDIITRRLVLGGALLGIDVLDHIVVGDGCFVSYKATGRM